MTKLTAKNFAALVALVSSGTAVEFTTTLEHPDLTKGKVYTFTGVDRDGDVTFIDDAGDTGFVTASHLDRSDQWQDKIDLLIDEATLPAIEASEEAGDKNTFSLDEYANTLPQYFDREAEFREHVEPLIAELHQKCLALGIPFQLIACYKEGAESSSCKKTGFLGGAAMAPFLVLISQHVTKVNSPLELLPIYEAFSERTEREIEASKAQRQSKPATLEA